MRATTELAAIKLLKNGPVFPLSNEQVVPASDIMEHQQHLQKLDQGVAVTNVVQQGSKDKYQYLLHTEPPPPPHRSPGLVWTIPQLSLGCLLALPVPLFFR